MKSKLKNTANNKQLINSLTRGLIILEHILEKGSVGVIEMGKILGVNKSSAYRLLSTLEDRGFIEQDKTTLKYRLGLKLLKFGEGVMNNLEIRKIASPYLKELARKTRESSHLCILFQMQALFVDNENGMEIITANIDIGTCEPLYCSAVGKALLSFLPENQWEEILNTIPITAYTPKTITSVEALKIELKKTVERGYALDDEELSAGMRCVAAPILNYSGEVIASIGISGPITRIRLDNLDFYIGSVVNAAKEISRKMGYTVS